MNFIDDLTQKLTQTGQSAIQKTKEYAETVKLNSRISDEERRLNGIYQQIGRLYCSAHSDCCEPEFSELVREAAAAEKNIGDLREQSKAAKGSVKCAACGADLTVDMKFCGACGTPVAAPASSEAEHGNEFGTRHCPSCGAPAQESDVFCAECGTKL